MTELHQYLAQNMKRRREALHISQMELARRTNLSSGYIGELETASKFPTPEVLLILAKALQTKPYKLLMGPDDLADSGGKEAFYAAADVIRERLDAELDRLMQGASGPDFDLDSPVSVTKLVNRNQDETPET